VNREEALSIWAPAVSPWSRWTKAVLFSFMQSPIPDLPANPTAVSTVPLMEDTALFLNLPGSTGVDHGLRLAAVGYRPIPLYNACPYAPNKFASEDVRSTQTVDRREGGMTVAVIDVIPILRALERGTKSLKQITLSASAPPAFLIDSNRNDAAFTPQIGWFDNRSIVRPSDLPSGEFLQAHGINRVVLIQASRRLQTDLQTVLLPWQEAGITILTQAPSEPWQPSVFVVRRPSLVKSLWDRVLLRFRYRPNSSGAFGRFIHGSAG